jgi:hypothetical protein
LCERLPEAPAMPIVYAAGDALAVVFTVSVEETTPALEAVTVAGLKLHDTPADKPLAHDRVTVPENPPRELIETVELEELPAAMLAGENAVAEIWKSLPLPNMGTSSGVDTESLTEIFADRKPPAAGVNVTFTVQLAPTAKVPPQLLVWPKSGPFVPAMPTELNVRLALPVLTSWTATGELEVVPTSCGRNVYLDGKAVKKGPLTPVPVRGTISGLVRVLSVMVRVAVCALAADGESFTLTVQFAPGCRVPQLFVAVKGPLATAPVIENGTFVALLTVIFCAGLVVPTPWPPKFRAAGETEIKGVLNNTPTLPLEPIDATSGTPSWLKSLIVNGMAPPAGTK